MSAISGNLIVTYLLLEITGCLDFLIIIDGE